MRFLQGIYRPYGWHVHMPLICHVYTMYIPCIYNSRFDIPVIYQGYSLYILHGISSVYTVYIQFICIVYFVYIPCIYHVSTWYIYGIYMVYTWYIYGILYTPSGGWCCGGGRARGRAPTHLRGSAYILSRRHGHARAHARTSARPRTPERATTLRYFGTLR